MQPNQPYIHNHWKDLHVKNGCVCVVDKIAIPNVFKDAQNEAQHATPWESVNDLHGRPYMVAIQATGPVIKDGQVQPLRKIGKNLKSIILSSKWAPLKLCESPNDEIQLDFVFMDQSLKKKSKSILS